MTILQLCELLKITNEMIFICEIYLVNYMVYLNIEIVWIKER